jgi:hypothetical protein
MGLKSLGGTVGIAVNSKLIRSRRSWYSDSNGHGRHRSVLAAVRGHSRNYYWSLKRKFSDCAGSVQKLSRGAARGGRVKPAYRLAGAEGWGGAMPAACAYRPTSPSHRARRCWHGPDQPLSPPLPRLSCRPKPQRALVRLSWGCRSEVTASITSSWPLAPLTRPAPAGERARRRRGR